MMTTSIEERVGRRLPALRAICRKHRVRRLELFGSAATGAFDPAKSDLDFLLELESMPAAEHARSYFGLLHDLERLFGREVDLVELDASENSYFLRAIAPTRQALYAALPAGSARSRDATGHRASRAVRP